jgi:hypothetical protein
MGFERCSRGGGVAVGIAGKSELRWRARVGSRWGRAVGWRFRSVRAHEEELRGTDDLEMASGGGHLVVAFAVEHVGGGAVVVLLEAVVVGVCGPKQELVG